MGNKIHSHRKIEVPYGKSRINLSIPCNFDVIEPKFVQSLKNPRKEIIKALDKPINSLPIKSKLKPNHKIAISICDITRAQPRKIMLETLLDHISDIIPPENVKIIIATGTHRKNHPQEIETMVGEKIFSNYTIINHNSKDKKNLKKIKCSLKNIDVFLNKHWVDADFKITTGFVEPHFFAGFSGGPKMVAPGLAGLETILTLHNFERISNKNAIWGEIQKNPIQKDVRTIATESKVDFCLDVTLNKYQEITKVFGGEIISAHDVACEFARDKAMVGVESPYDVVITSNSGYPLDQNLYQTVKGLSAAAQITKNGGQIICLSECSDGIPNHGNFYSLLSSFSDPSEVKHKFKDPAFHSQDQWQVQILSDIVENQSVFLKSEGLKDEEIKKAFMTPLRNVDSHLKSIKKFSGKPGVCVIPEGPITIPFVESNI